MTQATRRTHPKLLDLLAELRPDQLKRLLGRRLMHATVAIDADGRYVRSDGRPLSEHQATRLQQIARQMLVDSGQG